MIALALIGVSAPRTEAIEIVGGSSPALHMNDGLLSTLAARHGGGHRGGVRHGGVHRPAHLPAHRPAPRATGRAIGLAIRRSVRDTGPAIVQGIAAGQSVSAVRAGAAGRPAAPVRPARRSALSPRRPRPPRPGAPTAGPLLVLHRPSRASGTSARRREQFNAACRLRTAALHGRIVRSSLGAKRGRRRFACQGKVEMSPSLAK